MGGMKDKLEEATVKLNRLKAKHADRGDELGEPTAHASRLPWPISLPISDVEQSIPPAQPFA